MNSTVHVSFPQPPDAYPTVRHWHAQLCHFVYRALVERFGARVTFVPWQTMPRLAGADALVTFLPHPALKRWKRSVIIDNDTFDVDKWRYGAFRRFGYDAPLDRVDEVYGWLARQFHRIVLVNDVTLRRVAADDPQVAECYHFLSESAGGRVSLYPHPIDKVFFGRMHGAFPPPDRVRMLVYHAGPRKNSAQLIALLGQCGLIDGQDFSIVGHVDKGNDALLEFLARNFLIVGNTSFSETGPINMIEYLMAGHIVFGHDEWWDGAGNRRLCWSYDPARRDEMATNLQHLLREWPVEAAVTERDRLWQWWNNRDDNNWSCVTDELCRRVDALLSGRFPAGGEN